MPNFRDVLLTVTEVGDSAVLSLIVLISAAYLACSRAGRGAGALLLAFLAAASGIGLAKLWFLGCAGNQAFSSIRSPSGHTALSTAVYVLLAVLLGAQWRGLPRLVVMASGSVLAAVIAFSRVWLGFHSLEEVVLGALIGALATVLGCFFLFGAGRAAPRFKPLPLLLLILALALLLHGTRLPAEQWIRKMAAQLPFHLALCRTEGS